MFNSQNSGYSLADIAAATGGTRDGAGWGGFGGDGWWVILLFLFAFGGWGNGFGGWGGNGGAGSAATVAYDFDISDLKSSIASNGASIANGFYALNTGLLNGFADVTAAITGSVNDVRHDICDQELQACQNTSSILTAGLQNTYSLATQLNNMAAQQSACCCDVKQLIGQEFAQLQYNIATEECATRQNSTDNTRAIIDTQNANTRAILDFLTQDRLTALQNENAALKGQISQAEQNAFLVNALRPQPDPAYIVPNPYAYYAGTSGCTCGM